MLRSRALFWSAPGTNNTYNLLRITYLVISLEFFQGSQHFEFKHVPNLMSQIVETKTKNLIKIPQKVGVGAKENVRLWLQPTELGSGSATLFIVHENLILIFVIL